MINKLIFLPEKLFNNRKKEVTLGKIKFQKIPLKVPVIISTKLNNNSGGLELKDAILGNNQNRDLPQSYFCRVESLEKGLWQHLNPKKAVLPASFFYSKGVGCHIKEGIRCITVFYNNLLHCYILSQESSHYYKTMTKLNRMPILKNQTI